MKWLHNLWRIIARVWRAPAPALVIAVNTPPAPRPIKEAPTPAVDMVPLLAMDIIPPPQATPERSSQELARERIGHAPRPRDVFLPHPPRERKPRAESEPKIKIERPKRTVLHVAEPAPPPLDPKAPRAFTFDRDSVEEDGTHYYRGSLLTELEVFFRVVRRLRLTDKDAYDLFSRIGVSVMPQRMLVPRRDLPAFWHEKKHRPSIGGMAIALDLIDTKESLYPRMFYFQKMSIPPTHVEQCKGDVYEITAYFDASNVTDFDRKAPKWLRKAGYMIKYHIAIEAGCKLRLLKHLQNKPQLISYRGVNTTMSGRGAQGAHTTNGHHGRMTTFTESVPQMVWDYPSHVQSWWDDRSKQRRSFHNLNDFASQLLVMAAHYANAAETGIRAEVTDSANHSAVFAVDMKRTAYFFKDRDTVLTPKGARARIFHIVKPHERKLRNGRMLPCKMHFRGLRKFKWAGYDVHITVPGLHHFPLFEMTIGMIDNQAAIERGRAKDSRDNIYANEFGAYLRAVVHGEKTEADDIRSNWKSRKRALDERDKLDRQRTKPHA